MSLSSDISTTSTALSDIKTAIIAKGVTPSGNITTYATAIGSIQTEPTLASLTVTPSTTAQTLTPPSGTDGYNTVNVSAVTASIDNNITAGNIKKDVNILGVTGTYEGSGSEETIMLQNIVDTTATINLTDTNSIYKITPSANTTFTFNNNTSASSSVAYTFELYIDMQTNYTMTFPNTVVWQDNTAPDLSRTGKFLLAFRTMDAGASWIGNLQGVW